MKRRYNRKGNVFPPDGDRYGITQVTIEFDAPCVPVLYYCVVDLWCDEKQVSLSEDEDDAKYICNLLNQEERDNMRPWGKELNLITYLVMVNDQIENEHTDYMAARHEARELSLKCKHGYVYSVIEQQTIRTRFEREHWERGSILQSDFGEKI